MKVQRYKKGHSFSYALGTTLTIELLRSKPKDVIRVFVSPSAIYDGGIIKVLDLCRENDIKVINDDKPFRVLSPKDNCYAIGEFRKGTTELEEGNHIVLVNPANSGNLGTIIRTAVSFGYKNIATIGSSIDYYDPKVVRASMGAIFFSKIRNFNDIQEYMSSYPENKMFAFMLNATGTLDDIECEGTYSLVFGNEATGLPQEYANFSRTIRIRQSDKTDSLNLAVAAGIAMYTFSRKSNNEVLL